MFETQEINRRKWEERTTALLLHFTLNMLVKMSNDSLNTEGQTGDKLCLVTIDTRVSVTTARPNIAAGLPKRKLSIPYILTMASGKILPMLKEILVEMTPGHGPIHNWMFNPEIRNKFIPVLDVLCTNDGFMHFRSNVLWLGQEEIMH